jgi:uncharacterized surface protein with fasciclin (FAS1) repeats
MFPHPAAFPLLAALACCLPLSAAHAQKGVPPTSVLVGGQPLNSDRDAMENLGRSPEHTTFVALLRSAGLADTLAGHGPFTIFAPTNAAFRALPPGMLDDLRRPENKARLTALLEANILSGNFSVARLHYLLRQNKGQVELDTEAETKLTAQLNGPPNIIVKDGKGDVADIVTYDVKQANGVLHVTDRVMLPD